MLYDVTEDQHELEDLAAIEPALVNEGLALLEQWTADEMRRSQRTVDPMWIVMREGGPFHARFTSPQFEAYKQRLRETGRGQHAEDLQRRRERLSNDRATRPSSPRCPGRRSRSILCVCSPGDPQRPSRSAPVCSVVAAGLSVIDASFFGLMAERL